MYFIFASNEFWIMEITHMLDMDIKFDDIVLIVSSIVSLKTWNLRTKYFKTNVFLSPLSKQPEVYDWQVRRINQQIKERFFAVTLKVQINLLSFTKSESSCNDYSLLILHQETVDTN